MRRFTGTYAPDGKQTRLAARVAAGNRCIRCNHPNDATTGHVLTTHHFDGNKSNDEWWNLLALCQRCHLKVQGKVDPEVPYFLEHSDWIKPYVGGFLAKKYMGLDLEKYQVILFIYELTTLEIRATQKGFAEYLSALRKKILDSRLLEKERAGKVLLSQMQDGCSHEHGSGSIRGARLREDQPRRKAETRTPGNCGAVTRKEVEA